MVVKLFLQWNPKIYIVVDYLIIKKLEDGHLKLFKFCVKYDSLLKNLPLEYPDSKSGNLRFTPLEAQLRPVRIFTVFLRSQNRQGIDGLKVLITWTVELNSVLFSRYPNKLGNLNLSVHEWILQFSSNFWKIFGTEAYML